MASVLSKILLICSDPQCERHADELATWREAVQILPGCKLETSLRKAKAKAGMKSRHRPSAGRPLRCNERYNLRIARSQPDGLMLTSGAGGLPTRLKSSDNNQFIRVGFVQRHYFIGRIRLNETRVSLRV